MWHPLIISPFLIPCYFYVLYTLSKFVFTMLLICQISKIRNYGFIWYVLTEIGSILRFKQAFTVYHPSSSIFRCPAISNNYFCKLFSSCTWKALNYIFGSINFCSKDIFHFSAFTRLTILEFQIVFLCLM